jgi:hypothetical protein
MKRRAIFKLMLLLLFIFAGAIVNVGVAWACAYVGHRPLAFSGTPIPRMDVLPDDEVSYWQDRRPTSWPATPAQYEREMKHFGRVETVMCTHKVDQNGETLHLLRQLEVGFPLQTLTCGEWNHAVVTKTSIVTMQHFATDAFLWAPTIIQVYSLPLQPQWGAFVGNTAVYALLLWCLFGLPFSLRRRRKAERVSNVTGQPSSSLRSPDAASAEG